MFLITLTFAFKVVDVVVLVAVVIFITTLPSLLSLRSNCRAPCFPSGSHCHLHLLHCSGCSCCLQQQTMTAFLGLCRVACRRAALLARGRATVSAGTRPGRHAAAAQLQWLHHRHFPTITCHWSEVLQKFLP